MIDAIVSVQADWAAKLKVGQWVDGIAEAEPGAFAILEIRPSARGANWTELVLERATRMRNGRHYERAVLADHDLLSYEAQLREQKGHDVRLEMWFCADAPEEDRYWAIAFDSEKETARA